MTPPRPVRVAAVTLAPDVWGAEHSLLNLAPHLREEGVELRLVAPPGGEFERRWRLLDLPFTALEVPARSGLRPHSGEGFLPLRRVLGEVPRSAVTVRQLHRAARGADVVHSNALLTHLDSVAAGRLAGRPVVVELHDLVPPGPGRALLTAAVLGASATIAVSSLVRDQLPDVARSRVRVLGQGIDVARFAAARSAAARATAGTRARLTADPAALLVGAVGRVDPVKKLEHVVDAVAEVRARGVDVHLAVVGAPSLDDGGYLQRLQRQAAAQLPGAHRFVGAVEDVPAAMTSLDAFVNACEVEAFGLVSLEAMACGLPVVVASTGGTVDVVDDGATGLHFDPRTPGDLAGALHRLLVSAPLRERLSAAAAAAAAPRTAAARASALAATYHHLARRPPAASPETTTTTGGR